MAAGKKSRMISVKLISMAMTGFFKVLTRPRKARMLSKMGYDPIVKRHVLFLEQRGRKKGSGML